MKTQSRHNVKS